MSAVNQPLLFERVSLRRKKGKRGKHYTVHTFGINLLQIGLELSGIARDARNDTIHRLSLPLPALNFVQARYHLPTI